MNRPRIARIWRIQADKTNALLRWELSFLRSKARNLALAALRFLFALLMALCAHYVNGMTKF